MYIKDWKTEILKCINNKLDEVAISSRELTEPEILKLYSEQKVYLDIYSELEEKHGLFFNEMLFILALEQLVEKEEIVVIYKITEKGKKRLE